MNHKYIEKSLSTQGDSVIPTPQFTLRKSIYLAKEGFSFVPELQRRHSYSQCSRATRRVKNLILFDLQQPNPIKPEPKSEMLGH
ncbi:MAG: hypothetical protein ACE5HS_22710 [bacterium]